MVIATTAVIKWEFFGSELTTQQRQNQYIGYGTFLIYGHNGHRDMYANGQGVYMMYLKRAKEFRYYGYR